MYFYIYIITFIGCKAVAPNVLEVLSTGDSFF